MLEAKFFPILDHADMVLLIIVLRSDILKFLRR